MAVPRTGLGNCRLRGAQCACAAPAVAVPPVLMLKQPLRLLSRRRSPRRGISISSPAPSTGAEGAGKAHSKPSLPDPLLPLPLSLPSSTPLARLVQGCPAEPNFCPAARPVAALLFPVIDLCYVGKIIIAYHRTLENNKFPTATEKSSYTGSF